MQKLFFNLIYLLFAFFVLFSFAKNFRITVGNAYVKLSEIKNLGYLNYDQKMRFKIGKFYDYTKFVKANTPEDAVIAIPPMSDVWWKTGNGAYIYYFIYPRHPFYAEVDKLPDNPDITYVLLVKGDTLDSDERAKWPKFKVPTKRIIYYPDQKYLPGWGIIELKK